MKGTNTIVVNTATVVEAMQEYLDKRAAGGKADKVESVSSKFDAGSLSFHFNLSERKLEVSK